MSSPPVYGAESSAEASNAVAALVFEHSQDLVMVTDWDAHILEVNQAWTRLLGWPRETLIGRDFYDLVHPDDRDAVRDSGRVLRKTGGARRAFRMKGKDGRMHWLDGLAQKLSTERLMTILRDATEEREHAAERKLQAAQRTLLEARAGVVAWTLDGATRTFAKDRPRLKHAGRDSQLEVQTDELQKLTHPDDYEHAAAMLRLAMSEGVDGGYDVRTRTPNDETWRSYRVSFHCERRDDHWMVHGLSQDVTELVQARDAARDAEAEARTVLENAPFASCILGPDLAYISVSGAWKTLFGEYVEPFEGRQFASTMPPNMQRRLHRVLRRALAGEVYTRAEEVVEHANRSMILRWQVRPWRAPAGDIRGAILYATDITDMVQKRRDIQTHKKRLRLALDAADSAVFEIDYVNETFWAGPDFSKIVGRTLSYKEATGPWPMVHPEDLPILQAHYRTMDTHNPTPLDARMVHPDGDRWVRCHTTVKHDRKGRPVRATCLIQDIHAQKLQEIALAAAERQANIATEAKSNFLANISHEIRTPMNGVLGVMQLIKREHLDAQEGRLLDEALASGRMLTEMLDDLLDFSKIETGQFEIHPEPLDPTAVLMGVSSLLQPAASAKGLTMTAIAAPDLGMVRADPLRLRQALYNIMGNAVKFTPQGSIEARLTRHTMPDGAQRLRFEVQDTGVGVPEAFQTTLFERFEQADGSTTRKFGGSGLGLTITKRLAEMMGGSVGFSSTPGQGSTFWIEIDGEQVEPAEAACADQPDIGEFRVLLVEDNPTNRLVISKILEALGVVVDTAEDGAEGVALAAKGGYDLVLMDIQMPGMDGLEATRRIRAMDGAVGATPIVAVTANVLADQRSSYADAGMDGVVSKPVSAGALIAEIARVTERAAAA